MCFNFSNKFAVLKTKEKTIFKQIKKIEKNNKKSDKFYYISLIM